MATHSSLPGKAHGQRSMMGYSSWGAGVSLQVALLPTHSPSPGWALSTLPVLVSGSPQHLRHNRRELFPSLDVVSGLLQVLRFQ